MDSLSTTNNHQVNSSWSNRFALFALVWLIGLALGAAYYVFYYFAIFHSDSASIQILAEAMVDETSLLPHDFYYGNQLILFRANLFIAPVLKLGLTGYSAYTVGSAINFSVLFLITFLTLERIVYFWSKSLSLTVLLFLPLSISEADYVLGQQSHLANVVFALVIAVHTYRACWYKEWRDLIIASLVVFLMTVEAPIRVLLVLLPLALVIAATGKARSSVKLSVALTIAFIIGYIGNRDLVTTHYVATDISDMAFSTTDRFLLRMGSMFKEFVDNYIGFRQFVGLRTSTRIYLALYGVKTLVILSFLGFFYWLTHRLVARSVKTWIENSGLTQCELKAMDFIGMLGVTGVLIGLWITSAIEYSDEASIRHFLWALQLCKLVLYAYSLNALAYLIPQRLPRYGVLFVVAFLSSTVATSFLVTPYNAQLQQAIESRINSPIHGKIKELMRIYGIDGVYGGDHWSTLHLEVDVPPAKAAVLSVWDSNVYFTKWLTRPSMRCKTGHVLYLLDRSKINEEIVVRKVLERGGRILERIGDTSIYLGAPVWDQNGCT